MASSSGTTGFAIGTFLGIMVGYLAHPYLSQIFGAAAKGTILGKAGYASGCGCGR